MKGLATMLIPQNALILIADGTHMLLLRNQGSKAHPDLQTIDHRSFTNPPDRELSADGPGVIHESAGPGRNTSEETWRHQQNEDRLAVQAARIVNEAVWLSGAPLIVIAPPRTLAVLRRHYEKVTRESLLAEIDKDLTRCTVLEIAARIKQFEPRQRSVPA